MNQSNTIDLASRFIQSVVDGVKETMSKEITEHAESIKKRIIADAMKQVNNLRIDIIQSLGKPGLELRIVVQTD